ncbi:hypothetical protein F5Y18DRAFT_440489 [Xylariaceae sp. FL1019]|nr:hypothetical protein F5Y18DRAFT_440489 [Xylariaceae sp. FL1019]
MELARTNVFSTGSGNIKIDKRWHNKITNANLPEKWRDSKSVLRRFNALQVLQSKRDQPVLAGALKEPLSFMFDSLPVMVQDDVNIFCPVKYSDDPDREGTFDWLTQERHDKLIEQYGPEIRRKPYHFWPFDVEQDEGEPPRWGLIVMHMAHRPAVRQSAYRDDENSYLDDEAPETISPDAAFDYLQSCAVIYPDHGTSARDLETAIGSKLFNILTEMDIDVHHEDIRKRPWIPPMNPPHQEGKEYWSTGLRVFEMIRVWLDRVTESYCWDPRVHDDADFWRAHPGWFNPDAVRSNMIGMAATMVNRAMQSQTRIAIEPIKEGVMSVRRGDILESSKTKRKKTAKYKSGQPYGFEVFDIDDMMPNRQNVRAFDPSEPQESPVEIAEDDEDGQEGGAGMVMGFTANGRCNHHSGMMSGGSMIIEHIILRLKRRH